MKASLRFRRVRWIRAQRHRAKKEGDRQFVSPGENATCVRSKNHLEPYATLFLLYPHTAFAQTQKGPLKNQTHEQPRQLQLDSSVIPYLYLFVP